MAMLVEGWEEQPHDFKQYYIHTYIHTCTFVCVKYLIASSVSRSELEKGKTEVTLTENVENHARDNCILLYTSESQCKDG